MFAYKRLLMKNNLNPKKDMFLNNLVMLSHKTALNLFFFFLLEFSNTMYTAGEGITYKIQAHMLKVASFNDLR